MLSHYSAVCFIFKFCFHFYRRLIGYMYITHNQIAKYILKKFSPTIVRIGELSTFDID